MCDPVKRKEQKNNQAMFSQLRVNGVTMCRPGLRALSTSAKTAAVTATRLTDRGVIDISGPDALELVQSLSTNDTGLLGGSQDSQYACFLASKGRVLTEAIVHHVAPDRLLLDLSLDTLSPLGKQLLLYKVRKDVTVKNATDAFDVHCISDSVNSYATNNVTASIDPRWHGLGTRVITKKGEGIATTSDSQQQMDSNGSISEYHELRFVNGIAQGAEIVGKIPLETNLEMLNGVSFKKGCYLGQEMVARSHFKGQIRKRVLPVDIIGDISGLEAMGAGATIEINGKKAGKLLATHGNKKGLALIKFAQFVNDDGSFSVEKAEGLEVRVRDSEVELKLVGFPVWWDSELTIPAPSS